MASDPIFDSIPLNEIDRDDHRFRISTGGPDGPLVASIERMGIITPVVLLKDKSTYAVVSGFKRITACRQLGLEKIVARVLPDATPTSLCIDIAVTENLLLRSLDLIEQSRVVQLLGQLHPDGQALCEATTDLGLPLNLGMLKKLRTVSKMRPALQNALVSSDIALPVALQLHGMSDSATAGSLCRIIGEIGLGLNRQREMLEWLNAISRREITPVGVLIEDPEFKQILEDADADNKQKRRQVREYLKYRRYPEISRAERRFEAFIHSLELDKGIQLHPPAHFEGQTYTLTIDFQNHQQLVARYGSLESIIGSYRLNSIWDSMDPTS